MKIIPTTHLALMRARRYMENAYTENDWEAVKDLDLLLSEQLTQAFDDPNRDRHLLAKELSTILALYSKLTQSMPQTLNQDWANA